MKTSVALKRTIAGPNQLFFQNEPTQSHLFQTNEEANGGALYTFLLVNNNKLMMSMGAPRKLIRFVAEFFFTKDESAA